MFKKVVFLVFRNNYRFAALGNFGKSTKYGDLLLISLGGRFKSILGKILYFFKIGNFISIDGDPIFDHQNLSINLWLTGTSLKILKQYRHLNNNFVNMNNPVIRKEKKLFQIYPIIKKKFIISKKPKIIFMGKISFQPSNSSFINQEILKKNQYSIKNDFSLIDKNEFWSALGECKDEYHKFENYKIFKTYLREQLILEISKNFKNHFSIFGEDKKNIGLDFLKSTYDPKKINDIYNGNICIDTGSILGSLSLHPRSIKIIESGGLLIQAKQEDSKIIWEEMHERIVFNNITSLLEGIEKNLSNLNLCNETLSMLFEKFSDSKKKIEENIKKSLLN